MTPKLRIDDLLDVLARSSCGDLAARVPVEDAAGDDPLHELAIALNIVLDDLAQRHRDALQEAQKEAHRHRERYTFVLESLPVQAWTADPAGRFAYCNGRMRQYLAESGARPLCPWDEFVHPDDLQSFQTAWRTSLPQHLPLECEVRMRDRRSGGYRWFSIRASDHRLPDGSHEVFGTNLDIDELKTARQMAEAASRAKARFLANMSHEIRTPMNSIVGYSSLLLDEEQDPDRRDLIRSITGSCNHLLSIINDILDYSKIDAGHMALRADSFSADAVLIEALDSVAPLAHEKNLDIALVLERSCPSWLIGDAGRVRQILTNLLSNAIKFTHAGQVILRSRCEECADGRLELEFRVEDTGPGIPDAHRQAVFKPFTQVDDSQTRAAGGTGLGLAISSELAKMMDGSIEVRDGEGGGSTLLVRLRLDRGAAPEQQGLVWPRLDGGRVFMLSEGKATRQALTAELAHAGATLECFAKPVDFLRRLQQALAAGDEPAPLAVLLDERIPLDHLEAVFDDWVERNAWPADLYLLTPRPRQFVRRGRHIPCLRLPVRPWDFTTRLAERVREDGPAPEAATGRPPPDTRPAQAPLSILVVEDHVDSQRVAQRLLTHLGQQPDIARNGIQAIEMTRRSRYDLLLMDISMPAMDGLTAARQILAQAGDHKPRIIALTGNVLAEHQEACRNAGMHGFVAKPLDLNSLRGILQETAGALEQRACAATAGS